MKQPRHFISLLDITRDEFHNIIYTAIDLKNNKDLSFKPLKNQVLALIFEKSSTRTRISFEISMVQLGGNVLFLSTLDTQLGRGETLRDSAKVISSMVDCIVLRTHAHKTVTTFSAHSSVPIINGLTESLHPCQLLADMQTYFEHRGNIKDKVVTWIGDGNNMCHSYINASLILDFKLNIACPVDYKPNKDIVNMAGKRINFFDTAQQASKKSDLVITDVWTSMGQEQQRQKRQNALIDYQVTPSVMAVANDDALFMHCLPAHRGEEVAAEVIDGPQSVVFEAAENRLHSQKALLNFLLAAKL